MTCICGHHEAVHHAMCGAPEGCDCTKFRKPAQNPEPFVDETKAVQDAMWLAGSEADTAERNLARAYLTLVATLADAQADKAHSLTESDLRTLLATLAEARKDSERLDWLERHQGRVSGPALDNPRWVVWADDAANDVEADNFRDAIDRARRTPQPETPE